MIMTGVNLSFQQRTERRGSLTLKAAELAEGDECVAFRSGTRSWKRAQGDTEAGWVGGWSTHTGFDRRPRLPFLPMTGVPKCSGLVSGSLSSVCAGKDKSHGGGQSVCARRANDLPTPGRGKRHSNEERARNERCETSFFLCFLLTSLSAKWRAPFRQREERLRVFSSPSSNTADETG